MSKEAMENEEKRINNTSSEWTVEKYLYMRKEVLDKQKDLEKTNMEMVEKLRLSDEKFEKLSNDLQSKMDRIIETLKAEKSSEVVEKIRLCDEKIEQMSKEHQEKMDSIQSKLNEIDDTLKPEVSSEIDKLSNDLQSKMDKIVETLKPETISGIEQHIRLFDERIEKLSNEQHEKFVRLDMRKEFLDKQKDLEKSNSEIVEKVRACDERIENLSKELQSKLNQIDETLKTEVSSKILEKVRLSDEKIDKLSNDLQSKMDKIIETHKPEASSEVVEKIRLCDEKIENLSKEHREKLDSIQSKLIEIVETVKPEVPKIVDNNDPATSGKYFVLKHTFNNVSSFKTGKDYFSAEEEHFGFPWQIYVRRNDGFLGIFLYNSLLENTEKEREIEVEYKLKIVTHSSRGKKEKKKGKSCVVFKSDDNDVGWGYRKFIEWEELKKDFVVADCFFAEIAVKVRKMTGIYKENLRSFDKTVEEYSDVVLIVNDKKFFVSKWILATHSPYFKNLFMEKSNETEKSEIQLSGIDEDDFQNYLEVLYGKEAIDEITVEGILMVAGMYHTRGVNEKCENFLKNESKKTLKKKFQLSKRYNLAALMKQCFKQIE